MHDHAANHIDDSTANQRRLGITLLLVGCYMVAEIVGGLWTDSLALLADAGHMFSDAVALALSLFAIRIAVRPPTPRHTYGFYRAEILAAMVNGATLIAVVIFIFIEAFERLDEPPQVQGAAMMAIAVGGLLVNLVGLWLLHAGKEDSLNVRGAFLHVAGDALGSIGAIVAGGLIWAFGWQWADPAASVIIGVLVGFSAWSLLRESVSVLMEGAPGHIDVDAVRDAIAAVPGVLAVHDLHVWTITSRRVALSCHVVHDGRDRRSLLGELRRMLHDNYGVELMTIQIEPEGFED